MANKPKMTRRKRAPKRRMATKKKTTLVKTIKRVMYSESETKNRITRYGSVDIGPAILSASDWQQVIPPVPQATRAGFGGGIELADNNTRIGNVIKPTSCKLTIFTSLNNVEFTVSVLCTIYVFKVKGVTNYNQAVSTLLRAQQQPDQFLDRGDGEYKSFEGEAQIWDHVLPVNPTSFTLLHKKTFHLSKGAGLNENSATVVPGAFGSQPQGGANQGYKEHTFNIALPATLRYAEEGIGADNNPNNCAIFWAIGYTNISQETVEYAGNPVVVSSLSNMYFKDS